jgi:hypothetical protein
MPSGVFSGTPPFGRSCSVGDRNEFRGAAKRAGTVARACVSFRLNDRSPKMRTDVWDVWSRRNARHMGQVRFHPRCRKYCFFPSSGTVIEANSFRSISDFIESETEKHWKGKRAF